MVGSISSKAGVGAMTVNEYICTPLLDVGLPVEFELYVGDATEYLTFQYSSRGDDFADDRAHTEIYSVQVHYFAPLGVSPVVKVRQIKRLIASRFEDFPEVTYATDADGRHVVFEFDIAWDGDVSG
jgi:hypothetical protein